MSAEVAPAYPAATFTFDAPETIARWRVIGIVVGTLWIGSIILGFAYNLFIM